MSTSYLVESEVRRWCAHLGLRLDLITSDPWAHDAEYRVIARSDDRQAHPRETLFQGSMDRCSDFVRGYMMGKEPDRGRRS